MANKAIVRLAVLGLLAGILVSSFFVLSPLYLSGIIFVLAGICCYWRRFIWLLIVIFFLIGNWRTQMVIRYQPAVPATIDALAVVRYRDYSDDQQKLRLQIRGIPGAVQIAVNRFPVYHYGDVLRVRCQPQLTSQETEQSWQRRLQLQGISARCFSAVVSYDHSSIDWRSPFFTFKDYIINVYIKTLPGPVAGLMQAMIVNERGEVARDTTSNFSRSGLSHIVAISGMNMTLLIIAGQTFLVRLGLRRRQTAIFLIVVLTVYVMIIGLPASAVRAALMSSVVLLGYLVRRPIDITHTLLLVAGILALVNPLAVVYDIGWQLSFLALAGLIWWTPWWTRTLHWLPERWGLQELISATLAAQMLTWPLILYYFQIWALCFLPANILTVPLVGPIMISGLLLPLVWWIPIVGAVISLVVTLLIRWLLLVVTTVGSSSWAVLPIPFSSVALLLSAGLMIILTKLVNEKSSH
ncbi:MAG: ComEC/Rec2 family competence protein [Candidatus Komeilibacteria bacterium]